MHSVSPGGVMQPSNMESMVAPTERVPPEPLVILEVSSAVRSFIPSMTKYS